MAYQKFTGLKDANAIMAKISEYAAAQGWIVLNNNTDDLPIDGSGTSDGRKLSLKSPDGSVFANFRSAGGKSIFQSQKNVNNAYGIGLVCSTAYTNKPPSGKWYDQPNVPTHISGQVVGAGIPINPDGNHTLYINSILDPSPLLFISVETEGVFQHLAAGSLEKIGTWTGGIIFSGSRNSYNMFTASTSFDAVTIETESSHIFGMATDENTFLRADIDAAPLRMPSVLWASAGANLPDIKYCYTGKQLALPVKNKNILSEDWDPKIPHYAYIQSQSALDTGRNVNTLNCISVNMPILTYALRDPDGLKNYSPMGYVPGLYFVSTRNVSPGQCYEISYPQSGKLHQVFPYTKRQGIYGYDGFSIRQ